MRSIAIALITLSMGCEPAEVRLPLAELGKTRLIVHGEHIVVDPFEYDPCYVLADGAIVTASGEVAELVAPGGGTSDGSLHYDLDDGWTHSTVRTCDPTVWKRPPLPADSRDLTVEVADASAAFHATFVDVQTPLTLRLIDSRFVDEREAQTFAVEPETHEFFVQMVLVNPGPAETWIPDRYFDAVREDRTIKVTFPREGDPVPHGPHFLRVSWTPKTGECSGFAQCSISSSQLDHRLD